MRAHPLSIRSLAAAALLALVGLSATDCTTAVASCDKQCDCEKCPTSAYNSCLAVGESDAQTALQTGCTSKLEDLHACLEAGVCADGKFTTDCGTEKGAWKACSESKK